MLLNLVNVTKSYGPDDILTGVSFRVDRREKVALVGRNGTGKTTLLKIITGEIEPDTGSISLSRGAEIGYLKQEHAIGKEGSVWSVAQGAREHELELKRKLDDLEKRLEDNPSADELEEYATLHEHFLELEGYAAERDVRTVLLRMGFREEDFDKPVAALSGGERTRLALTRQILEEPDLLILDEPTNHLDLNATEWLEGWLKGYPGAVLIVSHDRTFLENVADRYLELRDGRVKAYDGPFEKFQRLKAEEEARLAEVARRQDQQIAKLDEYVRRFMNSQRTAQARGRLKMMQKLEAQRVHAPTAEKGLKGAISPTKRSGDTVIEAKKLSKAFGERTLFSDLDWTVTIGDRWGVIGDNGTGKSTLIKILLGQLPATGGSVRLGANVEVGYFSQDAETLKPDQSPLDYMVWEVGMDPGPARDLLGRFLITGDDVFRPIKTLSGGEKNKLSLARLTYERPNLLVLDEPTNHLDMDSREALAGILNEYAGTLVLVSHDRWLLSQVTNRTLHLRRDAGPVQYPGSYTDYRHRQSRPQVAPPKQLVVEEKPAPPSLSPRELSKEIQRLEKLIADVEEAISDTERAIAVIEETLANLPPTADVLSLTKEHGQLQERLAGEMSSWEENSLRLEEMRALQG
jgi:ATP-binding cassette subfamily F protein 3